VGHHPWCDNERSTRGGASMFNTGIFPLTGLSGDYSVLNTQL
jgi:hypothetical protein